MTWRGTRTLVGLPVTFLRALGWDFRSPNRNWPRLLPLLFLLLAGCAGPRPPVDEPARQSILSRLQDRKRLITSAAYRVRWQAKGTDPHGEFFMEIAYKAPDQFRVSATGPFGIPAFTCVIQSEKFWFVDHKDGRLIKDDLWNLDKYQIPLSSFFADYWRDLFAGGWSGTELVTDLALTPKHDVYEAHTDRARWTIEWDWKKQRPRKITLDEPGGAQPLACVIWLRQQGKIVPFWRLDHLEFSSLRDGGQHRWKILKQDYNIEIPDRLFEPLQPPPPAKSGKPK